jgi:hypothetical protein
MHNASCTIKKTLAQNEKKSVAVACCKLGRVSRTKNVRRGEVLCEAGNAAPRWRTNGAPVVNGEERQEGGGKRLRY